MFAHAATMKMGVQKYVRTCPCACAPMIPIGGGKFWKLSPDLCVPLFLNMQEDGTIDGTMQGTYKKKAWPVSGAPPSSEEMAR